MHRRYGLIAVTSLSLFVFACGDDAPGPAADVTADAAPDGDADDADAQLDATPDPDGGPDTEDSGPLGHVHVPGDLEADLCAPLAALACGQAVACECPVAPGEAFDEAACLAGYTAECLQQLGEIAGYVDAGALLFDKGLAADCVAEVAAGLAPCEVPALSAGPGTCRRMLSTVTPIGEACEGPVCASFDGDCAAGQCQPVPGLGEACGQVCRGGVPCLDGWCVARKPAGASCAQDVECTAPLRCLGGACEPLGLEGAACQDAFWCASGHTCEAGTCARVTTTGCTGDGDCGHDGVCVGEATRRCDPLGSVGDACQFTEHCQPSLWCPFDTGACAPRPGEGAECADGVHCAPGLGCTELDHVCAALPGQGEMCAYGASGPLCAEPFACIDGMCAPLPGLDAPCAMDNRCAEPYGCAFGPEGSVCQERKAAGGACEADWICAEGLFCDHTVGQCAPYYAAGTPCSQGGECGPVGSCMPAPGGGFACAPMPALGEACFLECGEGACRLHVAFSACAPAVCGAID